MMSARACGEPYVLFLTGVFEKHQDVLRIEPFTQLSGSAQLSFQYPHAAIL